MTLLKLLGIADEGYRTPELTLARYYDPTTGAFLEGSGDGLAEFVVSELMDVFDPSAPTVAQLEEAVRVIGQVRDDLNRVLNALNVALTVHVRHRAGDPRDA